jgi:hypothetical protein
MIARPHDVTRVSDSQCAVAVDDGDLPSGTSQPIDVNLTTCAALNPLNLLKVDESCDHPLCPA